MVMTADQRQQISDYLQSCGPRCFAWGHWDCSLFCADVLAILTGNDFAAPYRGGYSDRETALRVLPCLLPEMPEWVGLKPIAAPVDGAVWWSPARHPEGALGIFWQGQALQPGRRGLIAGIRDLSRLKFYN